MPFIQLVARVNSARRSELLLKRTCLRNETPTSFYLLCCVLGGRSRGASKCRNLIHGTIRRHSAHCASRTSTWLPSVSQHLSADPLVKEAAARSAAQMQPLLKNPGKCRTRLKHATHPAPPVQIPSQTWGPTLTCCIQMKRECGLRSGPSQLSSHWLVLG